MQFIVTVSKLNKSRVIVLPRLLADFCGFNLGDKVMIVTNGDRTATIVNNDELNKRLARSSFDAAHERRENGQSD